MIVGLDGLRALAFLGVFGYHTGNLAFGWLGVQLFFVLSGFLITGILLRMKESLPGKEYAKRFYGRRALRILPVYYLYLLALVALVFVAPLAHLRVVTRELRHDLFHQIWYAVFYVYDFLRVSAVGHSDSHFGHIWSLSVEEQFYLIWPLLIFLTSKKNLKRLFLSAIFLGPVFRLVIMVIYRNHMFPFLLNDQPRGDYFLPFSHVDAFAFGAYISRFRIARPRLQLLILAFVTPSIGILTNLLATGNLGLANLGYSLPITGDFKEIWGYSLLNYSFAVLIYCVATRRLFAPVLDWAPLRYLGKISYGLYLYHLFLIHAVTAVFRMLHSRYDIGSVPVFVVSLGATVLVAVLSYHLVEKPILGLKTKFFRVPWDRPKQPGGDYRQSLPVPET